MLIKWWSSRFGVVLVVGCFFFSLKYYSAFLFAFKCQRPSEKSTSALTLLSDICHYVFQVLLIVYRQRIYFSTIFQTSSQALNFKRLISSLQYNKRTHQSGFIREGFSNVNHLVPHLLFYPITKKTGPRYSINKTSS